MSRSGGRAPMARNGCRVLLAWAVAASLLAIVAASPAGAAVTAVSGQAFGYRSSVSLFGGPPGDRGPEPLVTLAPDASNSPQHATVSQGLVQYGPAIIFSSGQIAVDSQGSIGAGGSVTSTTSIATINTSGTEVFTAAGATSTCTAAETGRTGSTTITDGVLRTSEGNPDVEGDEVYVDVPANPAPNTTYDGQLEGVGDSFQYIFNEQVVTNVGGVEVLTVYAGHLRLLGPTAMGDLYWGQSRCGLSATGGPASPTITVEASEADTQLGQPISATATLAGGDDPTGSIGFTAYGPDDPTCSGPPAFSTATVPVSGNGTYASDAFTPTAPGVYRWIASYSGDADNTGATTTCGATGSTTSVAKATPTIATQATPSAEVGQPISDAATVSGGADPTGTVTFRLYGPDDPSCTALVSTSTTPLTGDSATSQPFTPSTPGTYRWIAAYNGDANNQPVSGACGDPGETTVVSDPEPAVPDCRVTAIAFESPWVHSKQQQVRIVGGNVGTAAARCRVTFEARKINPTGPPAPRYPGSYVVSVAPGGTFTRYFIVTPPRAGTYRVRACARAVDGSGRVIDAVASNDCRTTRRTAT